jgi:hypothetical protein
MRITELGGALRRVLDERADALGREVGFERRRRKLSGGRFVRALVFGWLADPDATLGTLAGVAGQQGAPVSPQGLAQRFGRAAGDLLERVLAEAVRVVVAGAPAAVPLLRRFSAVVIQDSTALPLPGALAERWPGCGNASTPARASAALKLQVRLDALSGRLDGPVPHPGRTHDRAAPWPGGPVPAGALWLADLGYFKLGWFAELARGGAFWLSRLQVNTAVWGADGARLDVPTSLAATAGDALDRPVRLGAAERLPARLLAVRVAAPVAAERRRRLHAEARRRGQAVSAARLALADWTILVTNLPPDRLSVDEALALARLRWQIELLFKLWKQHGGLARSRSADPDRILCEAFAKLLALLVQHWLAVLLAWTPHDRSLPKLAALVRLHALALAAALHDDARLAAVLDALARCFGPATRVPRRRARPAAHQLLATALPPDQAHEHAA